MHEELLVGSGSDRRPPHYRAGGHQRHYTTNLACNGKSTGHTKNMFLSIMKQCFDRECAAYRNFTAKCQPHVPILRSSRRLPHIAGKSGHARIDTCDTCGRPVWQKSVLPQGIDQWPSLTVLALNPRCCNVKSVMCSTKMSHIPTLAGINYRGSINHVFPSVCLGNIWEYICSTKPYVLRTCAAEMSILH